MLLSAAAPRDNGGDKERQRERQIAGYRERHRDKIHIGGEGAGRDAARALAGVAEPGDPLRGLAWGQRAGEVAAKGLVALSHCTTVHPR